MNRIKQCFKIFKHQIIRGGNNLKTPKFHQMLHVVDYIARHGCPMNYDGSRGKSFGKLKIKDKQNIIKTIEIEGVREVSKKIQLIIPMGIPGIGKTTFGQQLEHHYGSEGRCFYSSVSNDDLRLQLA